jgi:putative colanic acid biosynthesis UDP-glucose lipid carrier transferase
MEARIRYDLDYLRNWSLWLDLWIVFRTVGVVVGSKNAH